MLRKTLTIISLMPTRTRLLFTVCVGLCLGLCHSLIPQDGTAKAILVLYYFPIVPALMGLACWPLRSYPAAAYVSAIGCICAAAHNLNDFMGLYEYFGFTFWLVECLIFWASTMSVLAVAVLVRKRLYPVYPPGHCLKCGYDLNVIRKTLTILSLIGLLLSVGLWGVSCCWGISYHAQTGAFVSVHSGSLIIGNHGGPIVVAWRSWVEVPFFQQMWWPYVSPYPNRPGVWEAWMPLWIPTVVFGFSAAPLCWPVFRRRKRKKLGLCLQCGYDLRGSRDRCPECGTAI